MMRTMSGAGSGAGAASGPAGSFVSVNGVRLESEALVDGAVLAETSALALHERFARARPFRHVVLDDLFAPRLLDCVDAEFDSEERAGAHGARLGAASQLYFDLVHSRRFVDFLGRVSGIGGLITDPMLCGGGLHKIPAGGRFAAQADFARHPVTRLDNRLLLVTFLNRDWERTWGGALQLWDAGRGRCAVEILPLFGRSVLLWQSAHSLHGHPDPVRAPAGRTRRSLVAYFYSNGRDDERAPAAAPRPSGLAYWKRPALLDAFRSLARR
jgi:hypothetical protein